MNTQTPIWAKSITVLDLEHQVCLTGDKNKSMHELPPPTTLDTFCGPHNNEDLLVIDGDMGTGIKAKYTLQMLSSKQYKIGVNLDFVGDKEDVKALVQHTQKCMDYFNHGPRVNIGPTKLLLQFDPSAPPHKINVHKTLDRDDKENWRTKIDCPTVIHEIMHVLGLVDEYEEKLIGPYPCRSLGPENSIMNREENMIREWHRADLYLCFFPHAPNTPLPTVRPIAPAPRSYEEIANIKKAEQYFVDPSAQQANFCPDQYFPSKIRFDVSTGESIQEQIDRIFNKEFFDVIVMNPSVGEINFYGSLLGGHISSIIYPGCVERNTIYYQCAAPSRLTVPKEQCPIKPNECQSVGWPGLFNN